MSVYMEKTAAFSSSTCPPIGTNMRTVFFPTKHTHKKPTTNHTYYTTQIKYTLASALMIILRGMK